MAIRTNQELTKRKYKAIETRKKLFYCAVRLFHSHGYHNVTIDDIAREANTSKGAFYFHFKSKESVIIEAIREVDYKYQEWYDALSNGRTAIEQILLFSNKVLSHAKSLGIIVEKVLYANQISADNEDKRLLSDESRAIFTIFSKIIQRGQDSGELRTDYSAVELTRVVTRWIRSVIYNWCLYNGGYDLVEDGSRFFAFSVPVLKKAFEQNTETGVGRGRRWAGASHLGALPDWINKRAEKAVVAPVARVTVKKSSAKTATQTAKGRMATGRKRLSAVFNAGQ
jgi:AcrR family transcriptional regulator